MSASPETRSSLLMRVRDPRDGDAWAEFLTMYEPLIYRVARRKGLQDADAREVTQEVLSSVADSVAQWKPTNGIGSFRGWLIRIARNRAINLLVHQSRHPRASGDSNVQDLLRNQTESGDDALFDEEHRRQMFRQTAELIRCEFSDSTWRAFWWTSVEGRAIKGVAAELGLSIGAVYTARSRVLARLKQSVETYETQSLPDAGSTKEAN